MVDDNFVCGAVSVVEVDVDVTVGDGIDRGVVLLPVSGSGRDVDDELFINNWVDLDVTGDDGPNNGINKAADVAVIESPLVFGFVTLI